MRAGARCSRVIALVLSILAASAGNVLAQAEVAPADAAPPAESPAPVPAPTPAPTVAADPELEARQEAQTRFERGLELADAGSWDAALAEFLASRALHATRAALQNAALALRQLHRYDEALEAYRGLLREFPDLPDAERARVLEDIEYLMARVGWIGVEASEPGARIIVDGTVRGTTPLENPILASAGSHLVRVYKPGFLPYETRVDLPGQRTRRVRAELRALIESGRLSVAERSAQKARVFVDGIEMGAAPWEGTLSVGLHVYWLIGDGSLGTQPLAANVQANQRSGVSVALEPLEATLRVQATPAVAAIAVDGVPLTTGLWEGRLRAGSHRIELSADGFLTLRRELDLARDEHRSVRFELERDPDSARFRAEHPSRAVVEIAAGAAIGGNTAGALDSCSVCTSGLRAVVRGGYELGSGLGGWLDFGYLRLSQSVEDRTTSVLGPQNVTAEPGSVDDELQHGLWTIGLGISYRVGGRFSLLGRAGGGIVAGSTHDARAGTFSGASGSAYEVSSKQRFDALYASALLGVRAGYMLGDRLDIGIALEGLLLVALETPHWSAETEFQTRPGELGHFASEEVGSRRTFAITPLLAGRYAF